MALAANEKASEEVRGIAYMKLMELKSWFSAPLGSRHEFLNPAHVAFATWQIEQFEKDPKKMDLAPPAEPPDGPPIGADDDWDY
jgi:hypothetical protein